MCRANHVCGCSYSQQFLAGPQRLIIVFAALLPMVSLAGEISGLPANTPPNVEAPFQFSFSNDFLARGGGSDDFRTQQLIFSGTLDDRWDITFDHSILTLIDGDEPARTDQLSLTLGYRLINQVTDETTNRLTVGGGLRSYGDFGGERMQNGFHQLISSNLEQAAYTDLERTDGVGWIDAHRHSFLTGSPDSNDWRWGYWLRGSALLTSDGQLDTALAAYAVAGRKSLDFWFGLRQDWRSGYEEPVVREAAASEAELAAVVGLRWGPLVFETVQQFDGDGSYGQLRLLATGFGEHRTDSPRHPFEFDTGIVVPDAHVFLTGRWQAAWLNSRESVWRRSLFAMTAFGKPQHDDDPQIYSSNAQLAGGIEWQRPLSTTRGWTSLYLSLGAGWREEQVFGDDQRQGQRAKSVSGGVVLGSAGLRFDAAEVFSDLNLRIQVGLSGWVPFDEQNVAMAGDTFRVHEAKLTFAVGFTLGRFVAD